MWAFGVIFAIFGILYIFGKTTVEIGNKFTSNLKALPWRVQKQIIELAKPVKSPPRKYTWRDVLNLNAPENEWLYNDIQEDLRYIFRQKYKEHMTFFEDRRSFEDSRRNKAYSVYSAQWVDALLRAKYYGAFYAGTICTIFGGHLLDAFSQDSCARFEYYIPPARTIDQSYITLPPDEDEGWIIIRYLQRISYYLDRAGKGKLCKFVSKSGCMVDFPQEKWINGKIQPNRSKPTISGHITLEILCPSDLSGGINYLYLEYEQNPEVNYVRRAKNTITTVKKSVESGMTFDNPPQKENNRSNKWENVKPTVYAVGTAVILIFLFNWFISFITSF